MKELMIDFKKKLDTFSNDEVVCVDETGFCNVGFSTYGYFPKGKIPCEKKYPRRDKVSLAMAIQPNGIVHFQKQKEAFNKATFVKFLTDMLPKLSTNVKAVIMDNVAFHRSSQVKQLLEAHNLLALYIPPYSPRCNPIEEIFSIMKRHFRTSHTTECFQNKVELSLQNIKLYKGIEHHYNHTRHYLDNMVC
jgi:transposase